MDFAQALVADELWGWPVEVLDRLFSLRSQAGSGSLSIEAWREQDAALRADMPDVDLEEVGTFLTDWLVNGGDIDALLTDRLTALSSSPPSDEELWSDLLAAHAAQADSGTSQAVRKAHRAVQTRTAAWLTRPGSDLDPVTGLPWSLIARFRVVDHSHFGPVPQNVDSARRLALRSASDDERKRAALVAQGRDAVDIDLADAKADLQQHRLIWFPKLLEDGVAADEEMRPLLDDLVRVWSDPRVQRLLLDETSAGWPDDGKRKQIH